MTELVVTQEKADELYLFPDRYLFGTEPVPATLETIRERFGSGSDTFQSALALMHRVMHSSERVMSRQLQGASGRSSWA